MTIKQLTDIQKSQIFAWRESKYSMRTIYKRLDCSPQTISDFIKKVKETGSTSRRFVLGVEGNE